MRWLVPLVLFLASFASGQGWREYDNIPYTQGEGSPQLLDLYTTLFAGTQRSPAIVFVHGGGWSAGSKSDFADWGRYYAALGYVCISIDYRLTPQSHWPAQLDDTQAAVRWLRKWAGVLKVNPAKIGAVGASAGGHLALFLGATDTLNDLDPDLHGFSSRVAAVVDFSGPTDFSIPSEWNPAIWSLVEALAGTPWTPRALIYQQASPINFVSPGDAPAVIFQGDADPVVPVAQSRRIVNRMRSANVLVDYYEFPGQGHGFDTTTFLFCVGVTDAFFKSRLR